MTTHTYSGTNETGSVTFTTDLRSVRWHAAEGVSQCGRRG